MAQPITCQDVNTHLEPRALVISAWAATGIQNLGEKTYQYSSSCLLLLKSGTVCSIFFKLQQPTVTQ